jgi:prephenate dehydrogenase
MRIGCVGLGLIGGSLCKYILSKDEDVSLFIQDINQSTIMMAREQMPGCAFVDAIRLLPKDLDILFVCTPINTLIEVIAEVHAHVSESTIITDVASVKSFVVDQIKAPNIVPGHPIAGTEHSGFSYAIPEMLHRASYILIPTEENLPSLKKLKEYLDFLEFDVTCLTAEAHDDFISITSHLPYLIAKALQDFSDTSEVPEALKGPSFKSATRVAKMAESWGQEVTKKNNGYIHRSVDTFCSILKKTFQDLSS